jgi:hypothetical protein
MAALYLCVEKYKKEAIEMPPALRAIETSVLSLRGDLPATVQHVLTAWTDQHHLPPELATALRREVTEETA